MSGAIRTRKRLERVGVRRPGAQELGAEADGVLERVEALEHREATVAPGAGDVGQPHAG